MQFPTNDIPNQSASPGEMVIEPTQRSNKGERFLRGTREMGSIGSSDTYASCNTQPANSQTDLTDDNVFVASANPNTRMHNHDAINKKKTFSSSLEVILGDSCSGTADAGNHFSDINCLKNWKTHFQEMNVGDLHSGDVEVNNPSKMKRKYGTNKPLASAGKAFHQQVFGSQRNPLTKDGAGTPEPEAFISTESLKKSVVLDGETPPCDSKSIRKKPFDGDKVLSRGTSCNKNNQSNDYRRDGPCREDYLETEKLISSDVSTTSSLEYSPARIAIKEPSVFENDALERLSSTKAHTSAVELANLPAYLPRSFDVEFSTRTNEPINNNNSPEQPTSNILSIPIVLLQELLGNEQTSSPLYIYSPFPPSTEDIDQY